MKFSVTKSKPIFLGKSTENWPPKIHHSFHSRKNSRNSHLMQILLTVRRGEVGAYKSTGVSQRVRATGRDKSQGNTRQKNSLVKQGFWSSRFLRDLSQVVHRTPRDRPVPFYTRPKNLLGLFLTSKGYFNPKLFGLFEITSENAL